MAVFQKTARAEEDLIDIWLYIAQDNPDAANQLLDTTELLTALTILTLSWLW